MWETWVQPLGWEDPRRRERLPTPVFWPREFHGLYSPWGRKESDMTEQLSLTHWKWKWSRSVVSNFCNPMDCSLPGSYIYGIFQARVLEWVAISIARRSSHPRDWTWVSHIVGRCFTIWATREVSTHYFVVFDNKYLIVYSHKLTNIFFMDSSFDFMF